MIRDAGRAVGSRGRRSTASTMKASTSASAMSRSGWISPGSVIACRRARNRSIATAASVARTTSTKVAPFSMPGFEQHDVAEPGEVLGDDHVAADARGAQQPRRASSLRRARRSSLSQFGRVIRSVSTSTRAAPWPSSTYRRARVDLPEAGAPLTRISRGIPHPGRPLSSSLDRLAATPSPAGFVTAEWAGRHRVGGRVADHLARRRDGLRRAPDRRHHGEVIGAPRPPRHHRAPRGWGASAAGSPCRAATP